MDTQTPRLSEQSSREPLRGSQRTRCPIAKHPVSHTSFVNIRQACQWQTLNDKRYETRLGKCIACTKRFSLRRAILHHRSSGQPSHSIQIPTMLSCAFTGGRHARMGAFTGLARLLALSLVAFVTWRKLSKCTDCGATFSRCFSGRKVRDG